MSNKSTQAPTQTPMQFAFSESEYRSRCQNAKGFYESRIEKPGANVFGAVVEFVFSTLDEALETYHQHRAAGWHPLEPTGGLPTAMLLESPMASYITMYLKKPERDQEKDLVKVCKQVKADYEAELERGLNAEIDRQIELVRVKDEENRIEAEKQQLIDREQQVRDELAATRAKLKAELIKSGRLNAQGNAQ